jgi:hypothetical protein
MTDTPTPINKGGDPVDVANWYLAKLEKEQQPEEAISDARLFFEKLRASRSVNQAMLGLEDDIRAGGLSSKDFFTKRLYPVWALLKKLALPKDATVGPEKHALTKVTFPRLVIGMKLLAEGMSLSDISDTASIPTGLWSDYGIGVNRRSSLKAPRIDTAQVALVRAAIRESAGGGISKEQKAALGITSTNLSKIRASMFPEKGSEGKSSRPGAGAPPSDRRKRSYIWQI